MEGAQLQGVHAWRGAQRAPCPQLARSPWPLLPPLLITQGLTHVVRCEDWPVMPCESLSFHLKPWNFFTESPCVDLPPARNKATLDHDQTRFAARGAAASAAGSSAAGAPASLPACCAKPTAPVALAPRSKL